MDILMKKVAVSHAIILASLAMDLFNQCAKYVILKMGSTSHL
jgi:hypothetical protein